MAANSLATAVLSTAHLRGIGRVASEWTYVERLLEELIWQLAGLSNRKGSAFTAHLAAEHRVQVLRTLVSMAGYGPDVMRELKDCLKELETLKIERNAIVHALWMTDKVDKLRLQGKGRKVTPMAARFTARGELKSYKTPYTSKKIVDVAEQIRALWKRMNALKAKLSALEMARQERETEARRKAFAIALRNAGTGGQGLLHLAPDPMLGLAIGHTSGTPGKRPPKRG